MLYNNTDIDDDNAWNRASPYISQKDILKTFNKADCDFTINKGGVNVQLSFSDETFSIGSVDFFISGRSITIEKLFTNKKGLGTEVFNSILQLAKKKNINLDVNADYEIGPRFWAQLGFKIDENYWETMRDKIKSRWQKIKPSMPEADKDISEKIDKLLNNEYNDGYRIMWALADEEYRVPAIKETPALVKKDPNGMIPLSLALLSGRDMSWSGSFEMDDPECMKRANAYIQKRQHSLVA